MSDIENPPAFPTEWSWGLEPGEPMQTGEHKAQYPGMTLRDWFAGQLAPSFVPSSMAVAEQRGHGADIAFKTAASLAFQMADAMLAERSKS